MIGNYSTQKMKLLAMKFFLICIKLLGWHWLIASCRFQMYISMIKGLYIALCAHQSQTIFVTISRPPPAPTTIPQLFLSGNHHIAVCVHELYTSHMSDIIWFLAFSLCVFGLMLLMTRIIRSLVEINHKKKKRSWVIKYKTYKNT